MLWGPQVEDNGVYVRLFTMQMLVKNKSWRGKPESSGNHLTGHQCLDQPKMEPMIHNKQQPDKWLVRV